MKLGVVCFLAALPLVGCGHTKTTEKPPEKPSAEEKAAPAAHESAKPPPPHPKKTPVVESPNDLLVPGAEDQIRAKLVDGGYLDDSKSKSLEGGLRKFQSAKDLPVTGMPDHETIRRMGLDPNKIFRRAERKTDAKP
ncbi:MAG TPA: peptidoglycan-binding domain-containing protein [Polyangia bacterium]|jgi:hypothetical protein